MVDTILSSIDGDEVDSILDTTESAQVATVIRSVYYDLATDLSLPEHETLFELEDSGDDNIPCLMTMPTNVTRLDWIKYDNKLSTDPQKKYLEVDPCSLAEFMELQKNLSGDSDNVVSMNITMNSETFEILVNDDAFPTYYTAIGDHTLLFNSYNSDVENRLAKAKTMCHGIVYPTFTMSDAFAIDLDPTQFSLLINRAKVRAFTEIKQIENREAAGEARRQSVRAQKLKRRVKTQTELDRAPKYGRK